MSRPILRSDSHHLMQHFAPAIHYRFFVVTFQFKRVGKVNKTGMDLTNS